VKLTTATF